EGLDWLATEAGQAAGELARALGVDVTVTADGLEIVLPRTCPLDAFTFPIEFPELSREFMVPVIALPFGSAAITGNVGVAAHLRPMMEVQLGPVCVEGRILVNPLTGTYSVSGSISITAAASLGAEVRAGLRGDVRLVVEVPVGGVPVPIEFPIVGLEGGIAGMLRGIGGGTLTVGSGLSFGGGTLSMDQARQLDVRLAADLFLGAYAQLDIRGENVCRIYWQPYEWHGDIAGSLGVSAGLTVTPGASPVVVPTLSSPTFGSIPVDRVPLALSREGFADVCPIKDRVCEVLEALDLLPSQNGGSWSWTGPYGPGPRLSGPLDVYQRDPGIASESSCRGACGVNCDTCQAIPTYRYTDPTTGEVWEYTNFQDCNTNGGCREHDAAFDWAAAVHRERGRWAIIMPWHMAANIECTCNNLAGNCIAWIVGLPPYDGKIYFADTATPVGNDGGGVGTSGSCRETYPNAPPCVASYPDRDTILSTWGLPNGITDFGGAYVAEDWTAASVLDCAGGPGRLWNSPATDLGSGQAVLAGILECICCYENDTSGASWGTPHIVIYDGMPVELILDLCDRGLIPRETCIPIEEAPSAAVPSLDNRTWYLALRAIQSGDYPAALTAVLNRLSERGVINASLASWSYVARADRGEALTTWYWIEDPTTHERRAEPPVTVQVYTPAFADVGWLFSSVMHEYMHVLQVLEGAPAEQFDEEDEERPEFAERREVDAYLWEIEHAVGTGVINDPAQMRELGERLTTHFNAMTPALREQYQVRYDAAQQRVVNVLAGAPGMSIDDARRVLQESSREIAALLRQRPGNEAEIDRQIEEIRRRREQALIEVALAENPAIQVVRPGEPGTYRVPTVDAEGRVRYLHGGIQVAWHLGQASPSAYTLGEALGTGGEMAVAGTAVQGRVHPFPPDIDFDEHIHVVARNLEEAGRLAARQIIAGIRRISGGPVPGRTDLEFRFLRTFPRGGRGISMNIRGVLLPDAEVTLGRAIARLNGGNINTFWRGILADGRLTPITRVVFVSASRPDGTELMGVSGSPDFNLAFLEDPEDVPRSSLAQFAWEMCCDAVRRADAGSWLKAGKRAYNYFSTIGDTAHMVALEPVFRQPETQVEQYATVIDAIEAALLREDMRIPQARTRLVTVDLARSQVERVATVVESTLPDTGAAPSPRTIAAALRELAGRLRARNDRGQLQPDPALADEFGEQASAIRLHIDTGVRGQVEPIINNAVRPVCPDLEACRRRR
ncbi:MAG TPA: hypothetical protein VHG28_11630, partial [Longimicrobiaceae bacterium]|nr:hypothetical protein [Longimicrobiaceae bacterium]